MSTIRRFFDLNESTLAYHLNYLEKEGRVTSKTQGRNKCFYPMRWNGLDIDPLAGFDHHTLNTAQQRLLLTIKNNPRVTRKDLIQMTGMDRKNLSNNLKRFQEMRIIWKDEGTEPGYSCITKEKLKEEIYNRLVKKLLDGEINEETFTRVERKLAELE